MARSNEPERREVTLTTGDLELLADMISQANLRTPPGMCENCVCELDADRHRKHHEFMDEIISSVKRWNDVKWFSLKSVVAVCAIAFISFLLFYFFGIRLEKLIS